MLQKGTIKTVTFRNADNGYSVLKLDDPESKKTFTAVGCFPPLAEGESMELEGEWVMHSSYGEQFRSSNYRVLPPKNTDSMKRYLASGIFKGVGPSQAGLIVDTFGLDTFEVLDYHPERLAEIKGMGKKKRENLLSQWESKKSVREVMYFLQAHHLSLNLSARIHKHYGDEAVKVLKEDPYQLADDMWGIGFIRADEIARKLGFEPDSYNRIKAGLIYTLNRSAEEGHVFLPREELLESAGTILQCVPELIVYTLDHIVEDDALYRDDDERYYRPYLFHSEQGICRRLVDLLKAGKLDIPGGTLELGIAQAEAHFTREFGSDFAYLREQREGIIRAVQSGVFLLTGGPGTGKTTTLRGILKVFEQNRMLTRLAAPTGRAAKRMSEIIGHRASTIHRLLQFEPESNSFHCNETSPLKADAVVVDEVSMIDTVLMYALVRAIAPGTRVIFVGDHDQLPSVGPGKVLTEMITSGAIPHLHLTRIVRQEESSRIILNAHRINHGHMPELRESGKDFFFHSCSGVPEALEATLRLITHDLPGRFGYNLFADVQVLTPMNRGPLGTRTLNEKLQAVLNPSGASLPYKDLVFRTGDKVMQLRNNYDKNVFNGDIGIVKSVDGKRKTMWVQYDELVWYEREELDQMNLAYATTIHKSQGSEYRAVLILLTTNHYIMLQRNLFYTAVTRAKEKVFLLGSAGAIHRAVENNPTVRRNTLLSQRLRDALR